MNLFDVKERDINAIDENLTGYDRWKLNKRYKDLARESKNGEVDNKEDELKYTREKEQRKQKLDRLTDKEQELNKELSIEKRQARLNRLSHLKLSGKNMNLLAKIFTGVSAVTSMIGLGSMCTGLNFQELIMSWQAKQNLQYFAIGLLFFIGELFCGWLFGQTDTIAEFFKTDQLINKLMAKGIVVYSCLVYITSIYSNGVFWWTLTRSILVTVIYSFLFDIGGLICCYYGYKYINLDSEKIQSDTQVNEQVKNKTKRQVSESSQSVENKGIDTFTRAGKKSNVSRSGNGKMTQIKLQKLINENFEDGQVIEPSMVNMTGNSNFKNWMPKMNNVKKDIDTSKWIKQKNKFTVVGKE